MLFITDVNMLPFRHPFTGTVAGPTGCGKSVFVFRIIENSTEMINPPPERIVYCYGEYQPLFDNYTNVNFQQGLPDVNEFDGVERTLLVLDDLMQEIDVSVLNVFTKMSHHRNISVLYLTQNIFSKENKYARTMSLNSHYLVLFKNPRDVAQFTTLARQMYPHNWKFAVEAYRDATQKPYGYLLIDLKPETNDRLRLRTDIFPDNDHTAVYVSRDKRKRSEPIEIIAI